jgi:hypothetical protein
VVRQGKAKKAHASGANEDRQKAVGAEVRGARLGWARQGSKVLPPLTPWPSLLACVKLKEYIPWLLLCATQGCFSDNRQDD